MLSSAALQRARRVVVQCILALAVFSAGAQEQDGGSLGGDGASGELLGSGESLGSGELLGGNGASGELRVGLREAPPFAFKGPSGEWTGIAVELWERVAERSGLSFEYSRLGLAELLEALEGGEIDAGVAALSIAWIAARISAAATSIVTVPEGVMRTTSLGAPAVALTVPNRSVPSVARALMPTSVLATLPPYRLTKSVSETIWVGTVFPELLFTVQMAFSVPKLVSVAEKAVSPIVVMAPLPLRTEVA